MQDERGDSSPKPQKKVKIAKSNSSSDCGSTHDHQSFVSPRESSVISQMTDKSKVIIDLLTQENPTSKLDQHLQHHYVPKREFQEEAENSSSTHH